MNRKRLERAWKVGCLRATCFVMGAVARPRPLPDWRHGPTRILFLRQDRIGDAIVSSGILRAIAQVSPELTIDVLASPANAPILVRDPNVSEVHVFDKREPAGFRSLTKRLRAKHYDAAIDCMVTAPSMTGLMVMIASGARHRVGIADRGVDRGLTISVESPRGSEHIIDRMRAFLLPFGVEPHAVDCRPAISISEAERSAGESKWQAAGERGPKLLVNVSAGRSDRIWPEDSFVEAIRRLRAGFADLRVVVTGGPAEFDRVERIATEGGAVAVSTPKIDDLITLVATADLVFTPDTSVTHMASAFATPAVVMFQYPEIAAQWGLYRSPGAHVVANADTLAELPLERVLPELERLLETRQPA